MSPNPIKILRAQLNYSINDLEYQSGIHRQVIIRAEQGCYANIPPRLVNYLCARTGINSADLTNLYHTWVAEKRRANFGKLSVELPAFVSYRHPFTHWRQEAELSRAGVCGLFCLHLSTITRFEKQYLQQASIPKQLWEALIEAGYPGETLRTLEKQYFLYRNNQIAINSGNTARQDSCRKEIELYLAEAC